MTRLSRYAFCIPALVLGISLGAFGFGPQSPRKSIAGWQEGKGWGWVWGKDDEVGALNALNEKTQLAALKLARTGEVFDLGIVYDRESFKWPGHSPAEIMTFRTPEGVKRQGDLPDIVDSKLNPIGTAWHSCALFINDNVATQIDGLGHVTAGDDNHWYNGFKEKDWGGNWGVRRCDSTTIPPIIARGILIDVAGSHGVDALPPHYEITPNDLQTALDKQKTILRPGDVVLVRTGTLRYWGEAGHDVDGVIKQHDTAGINLASARWLVEQHGTVMVGSDTSGLEYVPTAKDVLAYRSKYKTFIPVHNYLLVEQGVHIAEFHYLEELAREKVYEFCYVAATNKIKGTTAGFTMRPLAIR